MSNKMLIDATHPEETRVVVLRGNRVEEFDFEAADRQQLRGNIYLAKVTRVEPSLQAAFVEYGGNRHGFLAFSEIHPDYYQIPFADRQALIQAQAEEEAEEEAQEEAQERADEARAQASGGQVDQPAAAQGSMRSGDDEISEPADDLGDDDDADGDPALEPAMSAGAAEHQDHDDAPFSVPDFGDGTSVDHGLTDQDSDDHDAGVEDVSSADPGVDETDAAPFAAAELPRSGPEHEEADAPDNERPHDDQHPEEPHHDDTVENVGAVDALEEVPQRRKPRPRQYKIQEVIKRRQVLLVQVVKEERGNKGAALTTYLSLAGRYSVLMPNTGRGGGISRKITNVVDRKRLKAIAGELDVPEGMGVILRTAGANRTKQEVKRDFEYLLRLWENVRELTLRSTAPKLVYEEGSLIKRSIRDLYSREVEQVVVAGDDAYREAKDFMRMLMPSHARNVQQYREETPIFSRNGVEAQLDAMFSPQVTLKSGGYIVINQTEALVSIDVNSGRSTREHNIEDTALNTNLEAAEEVARQLRLRDLAGLIVIDFIDMEENRNNRAVERKMKDCLRADRARIQVGRISHFGLMEMSRQRLRTGVLESSVVACPHCRGIGQVRSISSLSLQVLRAVEEQLLRSAGHHLYVRTRPEVALYVLNQKRRHLSELEFRFGLTITVTGEAPENGAGFVVERGEQVEDRPERPARVMPAEVIDPLDDLDPIDDEIDGEDEAEAVVEAREPESGGEGRDKRRRRRRRRGGEERVERNGDGGVEEVDSEAGMVGEAEDAGEPARAGGEEDETDQEGRKRRRGRRGGRRRGRNRDNGDAGESGGAEQALADSASTEDFADDEAFGPDDPAARDELRSNEVAAEHEAQPTEQPPQDLVDEGYVSPDPESALPDVAAEQVAGIFGSDEPATDGATIVADEVEAAASPSDSGFTDGTARQPDDQMLQQPEPVAAAAPAPQPVEDNAPKRSGWWNRKSFF